MPKYFMKLEVEVTCPEKSDPTFTITPEEILASLVKPATYSGGGYLICAPDNGSKLTANMVVRKAEFIAGPVKCTACGQEKPKVEKEIRAINECACGMRCHLTHILPSMSKCPTGGDCTCTLCYLAALTHANIGLGSGRAKAVEDAVRAHIKIQGPGFAELSRIEFGRGSEILSQILHRADQLRKPASKADE